jgi:multisubunit Na+/H+ antiporter MnhG subunit
VIILTKILIIISSIGLLRCSEKFRAASREFDGQAIATLKHIMNVTEEMGIPRSIAPLLILLAILCYMLSMHAIETALR